MGWYTWIYQSFQTHSFIPNMGLDVIDRAPSGLSRTHSFIPDMGLVVIERGVFPEPIVLFPIWDGTAGYISLSRTHSFSPDMVLV